VWDRTAGGDLCALSRDARRVLSEAIRALPLDSAAPSEEVRHAGERPGPWFRCTTGDLSDAQQQALAGAGFIATKPSGWLCPRDGRQVLRWTAAGIVRAHHPQRRRAPGGGASGTFTSDDPGLAEALREVAKEPERPDVQTAVRAGLEAARDPDPKPRNRRERRALASQRRRTGL
jgi:hypothetical protein